MTERAIEEITLALKSVLEQAISPENTDLRQESVHVGAPIKDERGNKKASLFLFHIEPNGELRNEQRYETPPNGPASQPAEQLNTLPLNLRYLITVFRRGEVGMADFNELSALGQIVQALHAQPMLSGSRLTNQVVRITPESYPMEEMSRIWGLFPNEVYRTSMVYLATPVYVDVTDMHIAPPVLRKISKTGDLDGSSGSQQQPEGIL